MEPGSQLRFLERIAASGTRVLNRQHEITFEKIMREDCRS